MQEKSDNKMYGAGLDCCLNTDAWNARLHACDPLPVFMADPTGASLQVKHLVEIGSRCSEHSAATDEL